MRGVRRAGDHAAPCSRPRCATRSRPGASAPLITVHGIAPVAQGTARPAPPHADPSDPEAPCPTTAADRLADLVRDTAGIELPVRVRAWDGSEAGPADGPVARHPHRAARCAGCCGRRASSAWPAPTSPATSTSTATWPTASAGPGSWRARGRRPASRSAPAAGPRPRAAAVRLGAIGLPPEAAGHPRPGCRAACTRRLRDRAAISHHYDLSNDFYELLLDETWPTRRPTSPTPGQSLVDAQRAKLDLICRKLDLQPGMRLLDVGCGWGSLILHAAEHYGVHATGVTLSAQQRDFIAKRIADRGLADRVEVRLQDYREIGRRPADLRRRQLDRDGRARRRGATTPTYAGDPVRRAASRPDGCCCSRCRATPAPRPAAARSSRPTSRPTCTCGRCRADRSRSSRAPASRSATSRRCASTTSRTVEPGSTRFESRLGPSSSRCVGEEVARVWRLYLVGGALSFEEGRMGVDQILAGQADGRRRQRHAAAPAVGPSPT